MSGHHEWEQETIEQHNTQRPFAPENGEVLKFKVGNPVVYTNEFGVSFHRRITALYRPEPIDSLYATGHRYLLDKDSYWMPVKEANLCLNEVTLTLDGDSTTAANEDRFAVVAQKARQRVNPRSQSLGIAPV